MTNYLIFNETDPEHEYALVTDSNDNSIIEFEERVRGDALEKFLKSDNLPKGELDFNDGTIGRFLLSESPETFNRLYAKLDHDMLTNEVMKKSIPNPNNNKDMLNLRDDIRKVLQNKQGRFGLILVSPEYLVQQFTRLCLELPEHLTQENLNLILKDPASLSSALRATLTGNIRPSKRNHNSIEVRFTKEIPKPIIMPMRGKEFISGDSRHQDYLLPENAMTSAFYAPCNLLIQEAIATLDYAIKQRLHIKKCDTCGKVFLASHGNRKYCSRIHPDYLTKTCIEVAISNNSRSRQQEALESEYRKVYNRLKQRIKRECDPHVKAEWETSLKEFVEKANHFKEKIKRKESGAAEEYKEYMASITNLPKGGKKNVKHYGESEQEW